LKSCAGSVPNGRLFTTARLSSSPPRRFARRNCTGLCVLRLPITAKQLAKLFVRFFF
jgi:hypothetical protein